jgi:palmitoyltransferase
MASKVILYIHPLNVLKLTTLDPLLSWPPPDPDRMPRPKTKFKLEETATLSSGFSAEDIEAFRQRQQQDYERRLQQNTIRRRQVFHKRFDASRSDDIKHLADRDIGENEEGEESWRTREGDRLADYGVDEEIEFYDEEDVPLAQLVKLKQKQKQNSTTS